MSDARRRRVTAYTKGAQEIVAVRIDLIRNKEEIAAQADKAVKGTLTQPGGSPVTMLLGIPKNQDTDFWIQIAIARVDLKSQRV